MAYQKVDPEDTWGPMFPSPRPALTPDMVGENGPASAKLQITLVHIQTDIQNRGLQRCSTISPF